MAVFYFRDAYGVVRPSDTSETFYVRDCYGVVSPSTALPICIMDAYGNRVLSNASPLYVRDANGVVVDAASVAPTIIDAYGNRVATSTGTVVWKGGVFPGGAASFAAPFTSVRADGWSMDYATTPPTFTPETSPTYFTVTRNGFTSTGAATTYTEDMLITTRVRTVYNTGWSGGTATPVLDSTRVASSKYIFASDVIPSVTNSSTLVSPKVLANWVTPSRQLCGDGAPITGEIFADHQSGIACVIVTASDGTNQVSQTISARTLSTNANDPANAKIPVFAFSLDVTSLTNLSLITVNAKCYPVCGQVADSCIADSSASSVRREFSPRYWYKDNSRINNGVPRCYVDGVGAGGGAWATSASGDATALANPFATASAAITAATAALGYVDGAEIRLLAGSPAPTVAAGSVTQRCANIIITRASGTSRATANITRSAASRPRLTASLMTGNVGGMEFRDVTVTNSGTGSWMGEAANVLEVVLNNINLDNTQTAQWFSNSSLQWYNVIYTTTVASAITSSASGQNRIFRGCYCDNATDSDFENWLFIGNDITRASNLTQPTGGLSRNGSITFANRLLDIRFVAGAWIGYGVAEHITTGYVFAQNVVEFSRVTGSPTSFCQSHDGAAGNISNAIVRSNTVVGGCNAQRLNWLYDETLGTVRTHTNNTLAGNILSVYGTKTEWFCGTRGDADFATHIGNWSFHYSVACEANFAIWGNNNGGQIGTSNFTQSYAGYRANYGTSTTTANDPLFVSYQGIKAFSGGTEANSAGNGDYKLQSGSPCKGKVPKRFYEYDLAGTARPATNDSMGAYV